jgi:hypothetical protein
LLFAHSAAAGVSGFLTLAELRRQIMSFGGMRFWKHSRTRPRQYRLRS